MSRGSSRSVRSIAWLAGGAMAVVLIGQAWAQTAPARGGAAGMGRALIASGDLPDLFLLYTGDVIGYLDPCG